MSVMLTDLFTAYQYGLKQLYYFNTHDGAGEIINEPELPPLDTYFEEEEDCEACVI